MPSCSIHHCFLFLLTLTLTTVPPVDQMPVVVKLNQPAVLPCNEKCSGSLKWTIIDKPPRVLALCNQTSCWSEEGFNISHVHYLEGDLSLTIHTADYSNRGLYVCVCDDNNIVNSVRLSIESQIFYTYVKPAGTLVMEVPMPGQMELTYKGEKSTDPFHDRICNVTQHSLQCKAEYATRVFLKDGGLYLENVKSTDNGVYTIWDKKNNEINFSHILFVKKNGVIVVKRRGSVTLRCTNNGFDTVKWIHGKDGEVEVAQCNKTSCQSKEDYKVSHDQYLKGNFSLVITEAYFRVRGMYTCECNNISIVAYDVKIETENISVQLKPGEDLLMDLPLTEPVDVLNNDSRIIYSNKNTNKTLYTGEYTHRLVLILKLEQMSMTDSGIYKIQNTHSKKDLLIYNVSVKDGAASLGLKIEALVGVIFGALLVIGGAV